MTMRVGVLALNAPRQSKQNGFGTLQFVGALFKLQKRSHASEQFGSIYRAAQEVIGSNLDALQPILLVR
jgi:hypothetical protein